VDAVADFWRNSRDGLVFERSGLSAAARRSRSRGSSCCTRRNRRHYSSHSSQIARQHRQFEVLVDPFDTPIHGLTNLPDGLAPSEMLFDAFALDLTDSIAGVPRRAAINGTAAPTIITARHMRRHPPCPAIANEITRGTRSSRRKAFARSAKPSAWLTTAPTTRPVRFSISTCPW
jgi:hypothetical protein